MFLVVSWPNSNPLFVKDNLAVIGTVLVDAFDVNDDDITPKFVDVTDTVDEPIANLESSTWW